MNRTKFITYTTRCVKCDGPLELMAQVQNWLDHYPGEDYMTPHLSIYCNQDQVSAWALELCRCFGLDRLYYRSIYPSRGVKYWSEDRIVPATLDGVWELIERTMSEEGPGEGE